MAIPKKQPKTQIHPRDTKKPTIGAIRPEPKIGGLPLAWRLGGADLGGPFSWANLNDPIKYKEVMEKLSEFEAKDWNEITKGGNHQIETKKIEKKAWDRLVKIKKDDYDELMSFRLTGKNRVWAIQHPNQENIMRILWWDPDHKVCVALRDRADRRKRKRK